MPGSCVVPNCRSNYRKGPQKRVYTFPKDPILRKRWILAMKRDFFTPTIHSKVCELHFKDEDFITTASGVHDKTGELIVVGLKNRRLHPDAIPSVFPNLPGSSSMDALPRESPDSENTAMDQNVIEQDVEERGGNVCELHFEPSEIIREASAFDPRTGRTLTAPLTIPRLRKGAVPTLLMPPPGPLVKSKVDPAKMSSRRRKKNQPKEETPKEETEETIGSKLAKLLQTVAGVESQSVADPSIVIKQELVESTDESPTQVTPNILYLQEVVPPSSSSSLSSNSPPPNSSPTSGSSPLFIKLSPFPESALPVANPDSANEDDTPVTNIPEKKRKINDVKPDASGSAPSATQAKLPRLAKPPMSSQESSRKHHPPYRTKESAGRSISPTEDTQNATREMFQSLMTGSENNPQSVSRTRERPGDLFDVFADFIAEKLREMNWDNCAFALRSILDIVFKAGQVQQSSEDEDGDISNPGSPSDQV